MIVLRIDHNSFSKTQNNGKTAEDLFCFIPKENRFQLIFKPLDDLDDLNFATSTFQITDNDVIKRLLRRQVKCGGIRYNNHNYSRRGTIGEKRVWYKNRFFRDLLWKTGVWKTRDLEEWCKGIKPDIILLGGSSQTFPFEIATYISKKLNIPTAIYCGDDYIAYYHPISIWDFIQKKRLRNIYKKFCRNCLSCMAISVPMTETFSKLLNTVFKTIPRPVDIPRPSEMPQHDVPVISYFGGLGLNRWKMIARMGLLVENAEIYVYSLSNLDDVMEKAFKQSGIKYMGAVSGDSLSKAIGDSDILLHVESDDMRTSSFTRLAVSTKIPEYLAARRFVLGFGPTTLASMEVLSKNNIGVVIDSRQNENDIKKIMHHIITDSEYRDSFAERGYQYALKNYTMEKVASEFKSLLQSAIGKEYLTNRNNGVK